jgi:hypothetical protein
MARSASKDHPLSHRFTRERFLMSRFSLSVAEFARIP